MARSSKRSDGDGIAISPMLLAAVLALLWIALFPAEGGDIIAPDWGMPLILATRFVAGFVAGWVVISLVQVVLRLVWLGATQIHAWSRKESR